MNELNQYKKNLGVRWIQADSGSTYLCPVGAIDQLDNPTEEQLKMLCVDESINPQND